jgi:hypothetical protein
MALYRPSCKELPRSIRINSLVWAGPPPRATIRKWWAAFSRPTQRVRKTNDNIRNLENLFATLGADPEKTWADLARTRSDLCTCPGMFRRRLMEDIPTNNETITYTGTGGSEEGQIYVLDDPFDLAEVLAAWLEISWDAPSDANQLIVDVNAQALAYFELLNEQEEVIATAFHFQSSSTPGGGSSILNNTRRQILTPDDIGDLLFNSIVTKLRAVVEAESLSYPPQSITATLVLPEKLRLCRIQ